MPAPAVLCVTTRPSSPARAAAPTRLRPPVSAHPSPPHTSSAHPRCLLLGVRFLHASTVGSLCPPLSAGDSWSANVVANEPKVDKASAGKVDKASRDAADAAGGISSILSALSFKPNKRERKSIALTTKCNAVEETTVSPEFVSGKGELEGLAERVHFDSIVLAEGEWSEASRALGFSKVSRAIVRSAIVK